MPRKSPDSESPTAKTRTAKKSVTEPKAPKPRTKRVAKPKSPSSQTITSVFTHPISEEEIQDRIAKRAYQLFLNQGGHHGQDVQHWTQAEEEIRGERNTRRESIPA